LAAIIVFGLFGLFGGGALATQLAAGIFSHRQTLHLDTHKHNMFVAFLQLVPSY
jgi:hypothetical protein